MPTETFDTPGTVNLKLRVPCGEIRVLAVDEPRTVVDFDGDRVEERVTVEHRPHGDRHEVTVEVDTRRRGFGLRWGNSEDVNITVRIPVDSDVRIMTASADVDIDGRAAVVDVKSASADVEVESMASGRIVTASGDLTIDSLSGDATLNVVSGDVSVGMLDGDVTIRSVSGDVDVDCAVAGQVAVRTVSGDVDFGVRRGSLLHVDAQAVSGDLESEVELGDDDAPAGAGDDHEPLVDLRVVTVSGDVRILRSKRQEVSA